MRLAHSSTPVTIRPCTPFKAYPNTPTRSARCTRQPHRHATSMTTHALCTARRFYCLRSCEYRISRTSHLFDFAYYCTSVSCDITFTLISILNIFVRLLFFSLSKPSFLFFFLNDTATTEISPLPLHDALPIADCTRPTGGGDGIGWKPWGTNSGGPAGGAAGEGWCRPPPRPSCPALSLYFPRRAPLRSH